MESPGKPREQGPGQVFTVCFAAGISSADLQEFRPERTGGPRQAAGPEEVVQGLDREILKRWVPVGTGVSRRGRDRRQKPFGQTRGPAMRFAILRRRAAREGGRSGFAAATGFAHAVFPHRPGSGTCMRCSSGTGDFRVAVGLGLCAGMRRAQEDMTVLALQPGEAGICGRRPSPGSSNGASPGVRCRGWPFGHMEGMRHPGARMGGEGGAKFRFRARATHGRRFGSAPGAGLARDGKVKIAEFGRFSTSGWPFRTGRNPRTGKSVAVPATTMVLFIAGRGLRDAVNADAGLADERS